MATYKDALSFRDTIVNAINPISISVFGSVAEKGKGNNIDIFIVTDDKSDINKDNSLLYKYLKPFYKKFDIEPILAKRSVLIKHFRKGSPFIFSVLKNGRLLYMKDSLKEWIRQYKDDYSMAEYLLKGNYFRGACLHAQQAIEKYINP